MEDVNFPASAQVVHTSHPLLDAYSVTCSLKLPDRMFTIHLRILHRAASQRLGLALTAMLLVLSAFPSQGQEARLLAEPLGVSQPEVCTGSDMVTFTLPTPDPRRR